MSIREVCSCGAEIETDLPEQVELVKSWRKTHKHNSDKPDRMNTSATSNIESATLGFQPELPIYNDGEEF